jgi:flavodoxin I
MQEIVKLFGFCNFLYKYDKININGGSSMKVVILYHSYFGNTEKIALSIKEGLKSSGEVILKKIDEATPEMLKEINLLIVGTPTRAFRPTPIAVDFLKKLPQKSLSDIKIAAFDTRISIKDVNSKFLSFMAGLFGYAAEPLEKLMIKKGGLPSVKPEGFYVKESEGPITDGELERASAWAGSVIKKII